MKPFLRSLPFLQLMIGIVSIPIAIVAALFVEPFSNAAFSGAGFATSACLSYLFWQSASGHVQTEAGGVETAAYMCTMAAILFLGTLVLVTGVPTMADVDQNASIIAYWLTKGLWYIAVLYIKTGCLLFCWTVNVFVKQSNDSSSNLSAASSALSASSAVKTPEA